MAERTRFSAYCLYSGIISLVIYPIEAGWVWGGGWLSQLGFFDFAGSGVIHMVGGTTALIGAAMVGPRIGKYTRTPDGKVKVNAIPGHAIPLAALGIGRQALRDGFRFNLIVNDNDGQGRKGWIQVAPGLGGNKDAEQYPFVVFEE